MKLNISEEEIRRRLQTLLDTPIKKKRKLTAKEWEEGKKFQTKSGIKVRSKIEKIIADLYYDLGIIFEYEKKLVFPRTNNLEEKYTIYCDFYLPEHDTYHEHFGRREVDYQKTAKMKKSVFKQFKMKFFHTTIEDEEDIENIIKTKLQQKDIL